MAISIKEEYGVLKILGNLNSQSQSLITKHLQMVFNTKDRIFISLEDVISMDNYAAKSFESLYREAATRNKILSIFGSKNKNISDVLRRTKTEYMFSEDRV